MLVTLNGDVKMMHTPLCEKLRCLDAWSFRNHVRFIFISWFKKKSSCGFRETLLTRVSAEEEELGIRWRMFLRMKGGSRCDVTSE